jgi:predicted dehydrogenase
MKDGPSVLVCGYGSIGRRHLGNLRMLGVRRLSVFRTGLGSLDLDDSDGMRIHHDLGEALAQRPDGVVVSNPTSLHLETAMAAAEAGCAILLEKPISHSAEGIRDFQRMVQSKGLPVLVGFQFRFHPSLRIVRMWIREGRIGPLVAIEAHYGEHLPSWHPWEDFRKGYSARIDLGGGVVLTLCHPLDIMRWLAGEARRVSALAANLSGLGIEAEDAAAAVIRFDSGAIGNVSVNYYEKPASHWVRVTGRAGTISWDGLSGRAVLSTEQATETFEPGRAFERNTMFLSEMSHFLDCVSGASMPVCTLVDGIRALELALAIKQAALGGKEIGIDGTDGLRE